MPEQPPVLTIDGPVGSGKGTIASRVAERIGWHLLDSGALYRLVALRVLESGADTEDMQALETLARDLDPAFTIEGDEVTVFLGERDVSLDIRTEAVSAAASKLAVLPAVRRGLVAHQRAFRRPPGLVADGRDMGTVIFPDAALKVFLTASVEARAGRRYKQLKQKGESVNLSRLFREVELRDERDSKRQVAPLKPAGDAVIIDSTELNINEVVEEVVKLVKQKDITS